MTMMAGGTEPAALPLVKELPPAKPLQMIEDGASAVPSDAGHTAPLAELTEALAAARAKLEQLNQAAAALAGAASLRDELVAKQAELTAMEEDNRRLLAELEALRARRAEWQRADDAAKAEIAGLGQALDQAAADAKELDGELAAVRWQNAQLSTSLNRAREAQETAQAETEAVRSELGERVGELVADAESNASEIERLRGELAGRAEDVAEATRARNQIAARVTELQDDLAGTNGELARVRGQLTATAERLNEANQTLTAAEQERDAALGELDEQRAEAERLSGTLALAEADLKRVRATNQDLEIQLADLQQAAKLATDVARQNLLAVENQILALHSTLSKVELLPPGATPAAPSAPESPDEAAITPAPTEDSAALPGQDGANDDLASRSPAEAPAAGPAESELALVKLAGPAEPGSSATLVALTAELPIETRIQAENLLADLEAEADPEGVKLIVPGAELFTVNSEEVRDTAHESLAKVAELINLYKTQPVLIIGHTDAIGAPDYNRTLSERRASLVRQFFIDQFDVEAARLSTLGMGEQRPIASNATAAGRRANRRVEVLILN